MTRKLTTLTVVSALGSLLGCAQLSSNQTPLVGARNPAGPTPGTLPVKVAAVPAATQLATMQSAESYYLMGRAEHGAGKLAQARAHYAQVLALEPRHAGALNAMAVIHAQEGRLEDALRLFGEAMAVAPQAAHLYNNVGYALLRAGRLEDAEAALLKAREFDPGNSQALQNLALLRAAQAKAGGGAQSPESKVENQEPAAGSRLVAVAPQVYALQHGTGSSAEAPVVAVSPLVAAAVLPAAKQFLRGVRVEVSNGAGVSRLARRTADKLAPTGLVAARLTNAKPYRQATTEIQFGAGQEQLAQALKSYLPVTAKMVAMNRLQPAGIQMRLVLGHDLTGHAIAGWLDGVEPQQHAAWEKDEGWAWS